MKYSHYFGKTVKVAPADAQLVSHQLLYKGGFVRRISTGRWALLPMGLRVWEKIFQIIDQEMQAIGAQRVSVPTLHPLAIWKATNRDVAFGSEMLLVEDHHGSTFAIGATAEGMMVELVKQLSPSYKDLPINIYQFSQKFRDDKRPRGGLIRVREFMMKDAYTFCATEKQALEIYQVYYEAYLRIGKKLGLAVVPVLGDSGAIGGSLSHEYMLEAPQGDQTYFVCNKCGYGANIERAEFVRQELNPQEELKNFQSVAQPKWVMSMEDNIKHYHQPLWRYLKNVVYKDNNQHIYIASIRGDQTVNDIKLKRALGVDSLEPATEADLVKIGTKHGHVHSWGHKATYVGDLGLKMVKNMIGGQKEDTTDASNVNYGRDFEYKLLADIVDPQAGDVCANCQKGKLEEKHGFEWGHVFKQDHFYTKPQQGNFVDQDGREKPLWMGAYGIGLERCMALIVEANHDQKGIVWPKVVAPFEVVLIGLNQPEKAEKVYQTLVKAGIDVLYDDRDQVTAGEKFADADLLGMPVRLVVSAKTGDQVEYKQRSDQQLQLLDLSDVVKLLKRRI